MEAHIPASPWLTLNRHAQQFVIDGTKIFSENNTNHSPPRKEACGLKIAIDGPAGAGKSTVAKKVADALGYLYIDTGAMYRAATWLVLDKKLSLKDHAAIATALQTAKIELRLSETGQSTVFVDGREVTGEIRSREVTKLCAPVSAIRRVRELLVAQQRQLALNGACVLDGRDIGTVVLPNADLKIFLTASPNVRAERRLAELKAKGESVNFETLLSEIMERDHRDSNRALAPLRMAEDAILILTDNMQVDEVVAHIIKLAG